MPINDQWPWRDGLSIVFYNGRWLMIGGWNPAEFIPGPSTNEIWESWDNGRTWTFVGVAPWTPRHSFKIVCRNNKIILGGGDPFYDGNPPVDMWEYDETISGIYNVADWNQLTADWGPVGDVRILFDWTLHQNELYMAGGQATLASISGFTDILKYDFTNNVWVNVGSIPVPYFSTGILVSDGSKIWMYGGGLYNGGSITYNHSLYYTSDLGANWTLHSTLPNELNGLMYPNGIYFDGKLWFLNGADGNSNESGLWFMNPSNGIWCKTGETPLSRHASSMCVKNPNEFYIISGNGRNDVLKYTKENL